MRKPAILAVFAAQCIGALATGCAAVFAADWFSDALGLTIERAAALVFFGFFGAYVFAAVHDWIADVLRERRRYAGTWPS